MFIDLTGEKFGRLTVVRCIRRNPSMWECKCDCGKLTNVTGNHLRMNRIKSCKCLRSDWLVTHNEKQKLNKKSGTKEYITNKTLLARYGITLKQYGEMVSLQNGKCKICERTGKKLVVDHNHDTDKVRHLLCHKCNNMVGQYEELIRLNLLTKTIEYLKGTQ